MRLLLSSRRSPVEPLDGEILAPVASPPPPARPLRSLSIKSALAFSILAITATGIGLTLRAVWIGEERAAAYGEAVHRADDRFDSGVIRQVDKVTLVFRDEDGQLRRYLVPRTEADAFVNQTLRYLQIERDHIKARSGRDISAVIADAFIDGEKAANDYADWYFAWGRSWHIIWTASRAAMLAVPSSLVSENTILQTAENAVTDLLHANYLRLVLKPELRDPALRRGYERVLRNAHDDYIRTVVGVGDRLQLFLQRHTSHMDVIPADKAPTVAIDWQAHQWKAPTTDRGAEYVQTALGVASGFYLGAYASRAALPLLSELFAGLGVRVLVAHQTEIVAAAGGSVIGPEGTVIGLLAGALADLAINKTHEVLERDDFVAAAQAAISATSDQMADATSRAVHAAVDVWFDDALALVTQERIAAQ